MLCDATQKPIRVTRLRYWNVETQKVYCRAEVQPYYKGLPQYLGPTE